jgi:hypothetical protein
MMNEEELLQDVFSNVIENCYNEKDDAQDIENAIKLYEKLAKVIQTAFWYDWDDEYLIDEFKYEKLKKGK